jgi:hypothetical protein
MFDFGSQVWDWIAKGIGYFFGTLKTALAGLVARCLGTFGLSLVTFNGILPDLKSFLQGFFTSLPANVLELASALGLDAGMSMIVSALTIRMAWSVFIIPTSVRDTLQGPPAP